MLKAHSRNTPDSRPQSGLMHYVLVVDDDPTVRAFLSRRLGLWGYTVKEASSAAEALELMLVEAPAIAILDIKMRAHPREMASDADHHGVRRGRTRCGAASAEVGRD